MTDQAVQQALKEVTPDLFKAVMGSVCTPVTVVTAFDGDRPHGTTVSAFMSLSLNPPMVLVALDEKSDLLGVLRGGVDRFGINILSHAQDDVAMKFAAKGDDKFDGVNWEPRAGAPHVLGSACWFSCDVASLVPGGDHTIVLGNVLETDYLDHAPLTYHKRSFGTHAALPAAG